MKISLCTCHNGRLIVMKVSMEKVKQKFIRRLKVHSYPKQKTKHTILIKEIFNLWQMTKELD